MHPWRNDECWAGSKLFLLTAAAVLPRHSWASQLTCKIFTLYRKRRFLFYFSIDPSIPSNKTHRVWLVVFLICMTVSTILSKFIANSFHVKEIEGSFAMFIIAVLWWYKRLNLDLYVASICYKFSDVSVTRWWWSQEQEISCKRNHRIL